jgi:RNA polymerase sigma-70 factor, ECF subfamily
MDDLDQNDIAACLGGDDDAFARLIARHERPVARLMWRFSRDPRQAEELVQDVFVEAYRSLHTYRADAPFLHWLRRIATRVGYRFWRKRDREKAAPLEALAQTVAAPGEALDPAVAGRVLNALLARLAPQDRLVLTLAYLEDCSMKEIAEQTGSTEDAVKMRAYRARNLLRQIAEREHLLEALGWTQ